METILTFCLVYMVLSATDAERAVDAPHLPVRSPGLGILKGLRNSVHLGSVGSDAYHGVRLAHGLLPASNIRRVSLWRRRPRLRDLCCQYARQLRSTCYMAEGLHMWHSVCIICESDLHSFLGFLL